MFFQLLKKTEAMTLIISASNVLRCCVLLELGNLGDEHHIGRQLLAQLLGGFAPWAMEMMDPDPPTGKSYDFMVNILESFDSKNGEQHVRSYQSLLVFVLPN